MRVYDSCYVKYIPVRTIRIDKQRHIQRQQRQVTLVLLPHGMHAITALAPILLRYQHRICI